MIRQAGQPDADAITRLLGELGYPAPVETIADRLAALGPDDLVLMADDDAGLVALHRIPRLAEGDPFVRITALVVGREHRRAGLARLLLEAAEAAARDWGATLIEVSSGRRPDRDAAHALYRAAGFTDPSARSTRYWKLLP